MTAEGVKALPVRVVVPSYEAGSTLDACLASLPRSALTEEALVVVDDGSRRALPRDIDCRLLRLPENRGPAAARNAGAESGREPLLAFVDADVRVLPGALERLCARVLSSEADCAFGAYTALPTLRSAAGDYKHHYLRYCYPRASGPFFSVCSCLMVVSREAFEEAGGFDTSLRQLEDMDFAYRLRRAGRRTFIDLDALAEHARAMSVGQLLRMGFERGRNTARLWFRHRAWRLDIPPQEGSGAAFVAAALLAPLAPVVAPVSALAGALSAAIVLGLGARFLVWAAARTETALRRATLPPLFMLDMLSIGAGAYIGAIEGAAEAALGPRKAR